MFLGRAGLLESGPGVFVVPQEVALPLGRRRRRVGSTSGRRLGGAGRAALVKAADEIAERVQGVVIAIGGRLGAAVLGRVIPAVETGLVQEIRTRLRGNAQRPGADTRLNRG